jgi:hypothetical protein
MQTLFSKLLSPTITVESMLHIYLTQVCKFPSADQTSSFQVVLESSNDQDHADGNVQCSYDVQVMMHPGRLLAVIAI